MDKEEETLGEILRRPKRRETAPLFADQQVGERVCDHDMLLPKQIRFCQECGYECCEACSTEVRPGQVVCHTCLDRMNAGLRPFYRYDRSVW